MYVKVGYGRRIAKLLFLWAASVLEGCEDPALIEQSVRIARYGLGEA